MKNFVSLLFKIIFFSVLFLVTLYVLLDPYNTITKFSFKNNNNINRGVGSTELLIHNSLDQGEYNSFLFGSSRINSINSYLWQYYLNDTNAHQFVFQAWSETLTGIEQKLVYLDENNYNIDNVLLLLDIPGTFYKVQSPTMGYSLKYYKLSKGNALLYQYHLFNSFAFKPKFIVSSIKHKLLNKDWTCTFDSVSNDMIYKVDKKNDLFYNIHDSLPHCSAKEIQQFQIQIKEKSNLNKQVELISEQFILQLVHIQDIFNKHKTNYKIRECKINCVKC